MNVSFGAVRFTIPHKDFRESLNRQTRQDGVTIVRASMAPDSDYIIKVRHPQPNQELAIAEEIEKSLKFPWKIPYTCSIE